MHYKKPHYYHEFVCVADKCPDTCCAGWQIVIDDRSLKKYEKVTGNFRERLNHSIDWEEGVFKQKERRCAFLNEKNLCDLYTELGPESLCDTCRMYPRHMEEFENLREFSLSLSCPIAAEMILKCKEKVYFSEEEDEIEEQEEDYEDFDFILFDWLEEAREKLFEVIQDRTRTMAVRMAVLLDFTYAAQCALDHGTLLELNLEEEIEKAITSAEKYMKEKGNPKAFSYRKTMQKDLKKLEILREEWPEFLDQLERNLYREDADFYQKRKEEFTTEFKETTEIYKEQLLMFFVYTYFCGAVYDDLIYTKAVLAVFSVLWIDEFWMDRWLAQNRTLTFQDMVEVSYRYAREIEHSDENLILLEEFFDTRSVYFPEKLKESIRF